MENPLPCKNFASDPRQCSKKLYFRKHIKETSRLGKERKLMRLTPENKVSCTLIDTRPDLIAGSMPIHAGFIRNRCHWV